MDSGGVETNLDEWFGGIAEEALAMSEDEPSLEEALKGDEVTQWVPAMRELKKLPKLRKSTPMTSSRHLQMPM